MNAPAEGFLLEAIAAPESESALIGALLIDNSLFDRIGDRLKGEHFFDERNREIYAEIVRQLAAGKSCDVVTVYEAMRGRVGLAELNDMSSHMLSAANIRRHADLVSERHQSRALLNVSREITELAQDHDRSIEERVEAAQSQLGKLVEDAPRDEWVGAFEGMTLHTQLLEDRASGSVKSMATGLTDLDDYLEGGLRPGSLVIIGARPSQGKTALGMTIGLRMAEHYSVAMLSMEMPHSEIRDRQTAMLGEVSLSSVIRPNKGDGLEWDKVVAGCERARHLRFTASDQGGLNINQVRSKARNLKRRHGLDVLLVDYIGLMAGLDPKQSRAYQLEEISRGFKTLAKELDMTVLCLAQLNRDVEKRPGGMPNLSDLRDSGALEQDADVVMFLNRPIHSNPELGAEWKHYAKLSIAKNRQGRCGVLSLSYLGEQTRFSGWSGPAPVKHGGSTKSKDWE